MMSPIPARPANVRAFAPSATPNRLISARPRVTSVALVLSPNPKPCAIPAAIAITFFTTPPISQPTMSVLVYKRNVGRAMRSAISRATASSAHATTLAAGCPTKISRAKFGPLNAAIGLPGIACCSTSLMRKNDVLSKPFDRLMIGTPARTCRCTSVATARNPCDGTAIATMSASPINLPMSCDACNELGSK